MTVLLLFMGVIAAICGWWLSQQRLMAKPWLEEGVQSEFPGTGASLLPAAKLGLGMFLAVVGCLFALLTSSYVMRVDLAELNILNLGRLRTPSLLWFNTAALVLSSAALQWAWADARRGRMDGVRAHLLAGAVAAAAFVAGQLLAWRELNEAGYVLSFDAASSFFYLLTGMHGLHILGGLAALGRPLARSWRGAPATQVRLGVELCAIYWHFLLLVWLVLFGLLMGWADGIAAICRGLIS